MANYILSIDSFVNAFSMVETGKSIKFEFKKGNVDTVIPSITEGDSVLVYKKNPIGKVNIVLRCEAGGVFRKKLEVEEGARVEGLIKDDLEKVDSVQVGQDIYDEIIRRMLHTSINSGSKNENNNIPRIVGGENVLLYGVPGVGKSHTIQNEYCDESARMERVVFHPDYTYSDFVGQILPRVIDGQLKYVFSPGPFTKLLKKAWENPGEKFYLIIEEINRGNAPAIFGEIFQLLDRKDADNKRYTADEIGESEYGITNYEVAAEVYGDENHEVRIPSNMWVLATMNTADQNVFTLDTAFQRRWNMHHIKNEVKNAAYAGQMIQGTSIGWGAFATVINDMVVEYSSEMASSEDKRLGAYFIKLNELSSDKFPEKVLKYLWDDAFKMDKTAVFDEKYKSLETVIETYEKTESDKLQAVLRIDVYKKMLEAMSAGSEQ